MGNIIVIIESEDKPYEFDDLSLTFDSEPEEILEAVQPVILEDTGFNIQDESGTWLYAVTKKENSGNIYVLPKSPAGIEGT